ncbi:MAG: hypothetical protein J2P25_10960 [Nocardiopsaceae bacterium]|nr:hypothetical protein [Nocardiopsaceae bacterium]
MTLDPVSRSLVAIDIEKYSSRDNLGQEELRKALRGVCEEAFTRIGVTPDARQDQGDAFLFLIRPDVTKASLVSDLVRELITALRLSNRNWRPEARMRLRVAVHAGEVHLDGTGYAGESVVAVMRLIEADPLKDALRTAPDDLAVIVSEQMYRDVVRQGYRGIDPSDYARVHASRKEFAQPAWIRVPGTRPPEPRGSGVQPPAPVPGGMPLTWPATFNGPTSFGGHAAGRDVNISGRDLSTGERPRDV